MRKKDRNFKMFIEDIEMSIHRIFQYIGDMTYDEFKADSKTIDAVVRNFEILGEAANNVPKEIKTKYPLVPWDEMYYMRNKVSHEYFGIDFEILWDIVKNHLPENEKQIEHILSIE